MQVACYFNEQLIRSVNNCLDFVLGHLTCTLHRICFLNQNYIWLQHCTCILHFVKSFSPPPLLCPESLIPTAMSSSTPNRISRANTSTPEEECGHLEKWFTSEQIEMLSYLHECSRKMIIGSEYIRVDWSKEEQLHEIKNMVNHQKLKKCLALYGCIYPDLVKVFHTNLTFDGEKM